MTSITKSLVACTICGKKGVKLFATPQTLREVSKSRSLPPGMPGVCKECRGKCIKSTVIAVVEYDPKSKSSGDAQKGEENASDADDEASEVSEEEVKKK